MKILKNINKHLDCEIIYYSNKLKNSVQFVINLLLKNSNKLYLHKFKNIQN